jgi:hypothetical protein
MRLTRFHRTDYLITRQVSGSGTNFPRSVNVLNADSGNAAIRRTNYAIGPDALRNQEIFLFLINGLDAPSRCTLRP